MRPSCPPPSTATSALGRVGGRPSRTCLAHRLGRPAAVGTAGSLIVLVAVLALVAWGRVPDLVGRRSRRGARGRTGLVGLDDVGDTLDRLAPTLAFLAAVFVLAEVARDAGLFDAARCRDGERASSSRRLVLVVSAVAMRRDRAR